MQGFIYTLSDIMNDEIIYVGSTTDPKERLKQHRWHSVSGDTPLYNYVNNNRIQLGIDVIEEVEVENSTELKLLERYWIHQLKAWGFNLRNSVVYRSNKPSSMADAYAVRLGGIKEPLERYAKESGVSLQRYILDILSAYVSKTTLNYENKN